LLVPIRLLVLLLALILLLLACRQILRVEPLVLVLVQIQLTDIP
jgi:hypothetical protein